MISTGIFLRSLGGNETTDSAVKSAINKTISNIKIEGNQLIFTFDDKSGLTIYDSGQSCCEDRYMDTDDNLSEYFGAKLLDFDLKDATSTVDDCDHEIQFLDVMTDKGIFTVSNHNEHNGYYGGFWIVASCW